MASILAVILAVILDQYVRNYASGKILQSVRDPSLLNCYLVKCINILQKISIKQSFLILLSALVPLWIGTFVLKLLFGMVFSERLGMLLFSFVMLFYFLGNQASDEEQSKFINAHESNFGVLFWYAILGFSGALIYWFLVGARASKVLLDETNSSLRQTVVVIHAFAAWIPARVTGFIYALVGNFEPGFKCWLNCIRTYNMPSSQVLEECGKAALGTDSQEDLSAATMVNRALIFWVVIVIVVILI